MEWMEIWEQDSWETPNDEPTWKTKDGRELLIAVMETSHIENTIKMLERNIKEDEDFFYGSNDRQKDYQGLLNLSRKRKIREFKEELERRK